METTFPLCMPASYPSFSGNLPSTYLWNSTEKSWAST